MGDAIDKALAAGGFKQMAGVLVGLEPQLFTLAQVGNKGNAQAARAQSLFPDLQGVALGRNRDELLANITQHGLMPMQGIWWANRPISSQPMGKWIFGRSAALQNQPRHKPWLGFCALQPIPKIHLRGPL
ncbi:hypothetical protein LP416_08330 [Polaromonas sp. P2-4]|nr:hypothetical protein LP416_08330 [Polaromonas sp. P2-4]